jgi:hypothetical protein
VYYGINKKSRPSISSTDNVIDPESIFIHRFGAKLDPAIQGQDGGGEKQKDTTLSNVVPESKEEKMMHYVADL